MNSILISSRRWLMKSCDNYHHSVIILFYIVVVVAILTETQCVPNGIAHAPGSRYDVQ